MHGELLYLELNADAADGRRPRRVGDRGHQFFQRRLNLAAPTTTTAATTDKRGGCTCDARPVERPGRTTETEAGRRPDI